jgi:Carboxypeptidase regulatory-like domain
MVEASRPLSWRTFSWRPIAINLALISLLCCVPAAWSADGYGKITGVVLDPGGTPQMGASVWLISEAADGRAGTQLLTNQEGIFASARLRPGLYSLRATLAGFLPTMQQHIRISPNLTTLVHIDLDSVFGSLDELRRPSAQPSEKEDWKWALRTSAASRPVLQLRDGTVVIADDHSENAESRRHEPRAQLRLTNGSSYPGSPSALPGALTTAISYDQSLGAAGRLLIAGEMSYDHSIVYDQASGSLNGSLAGGIATVWVPSGELGRGPQTTVVMSQASVPRGERSIRMMRIEHSEQLALSDHLMLDYGAEYLGGGIGAMTSSVRPRAQLAMRVSPNWSAAALLETDPASYSLRSRGANGESAIDALGTLPILLWKDHHPVLSGGWHEEISVKRSVGAHGSVEGAAFYDFSRNQGVYGFSPVRAFARDAGQGGSMGTRAVVREKVLSNLEIAAIYSWAGALAPGAGELDIDSHLQDVLHMRYRHSVAGRVSGKLPRVGTEFTASYKWLSGTVVGRQDLFGEAALGVDPYLSVTVRQALPSFGTSGHWEALVDVRNLMSQGSLAAESAQGAVVLIPVERSFRGGVSFQF